MENDKGDDLGLPQENLTGDEPLADGPAPDGPDMFASDAELGDLDFEPLDFTQDGPPDEGALIEGAESGDIDPDSLGPDPLAETTEFVEPDADGLLSPDFAGDEAAPGDFDPDGLGFPLGDESISDVESKVDDEDEPEEKEEKESFLQKLAGASPYTVMLGVALLAIVTAILFLFLELKSYDFKWKREDSRVMAPHSTAPADPLSDYA